MNMINRRRSRSRSRLVVVVSVLAPLVLVACPGSLESPERFYVDAAVAPVVDTGVTVPVTTPDATTEVDAAPPGPCPDIPTQLFPTRCGIGPCHSSETMLQNLDLVSANVGARLYGKPTSGNASLLLIDPKAPENSALYTKLGNAPPFGSRMPLGDTALDAYTIGCVLTWVQGVVAAGPPDGGVLDAAAD